jgi:hypothetical protein
MRWIFACLSILTATYALAQSWEDRKRQADEEYEFEGKYQYDEDALEYDDNYQAPSSRWNKSDQDDMEAFVDGNLYFVAYHEMGHALVSEFGIPIAGREEDAVDRLAIWLMTPDDNSSPDYLINAMKGWFLAGEESMDDVSWWGEHGSNTQRAYQIACLLYGYNPDAHEQVADYAELPDERRETCVEESASNETAWQNLLSPTLLDEQSKNRTPVTVRYQTSKKHSAQRTYLQQLGLLEDLAELMTSNYKLKPGIRVMGADCGEANAYWDPNERSITMCYELIEDYQKLAQAK